MTTLAMSLVAEGVTLWSSKASPTTKSLRSPTFWEVRGSVDGKWGQVRNSCVAIILLTSHFVLRYTRFGQTRLHDWRKPVGREAVGGKHQQNNHHHANDLRLHGGIGRPDQHRAPRHRPTAPEMSFLIDAIAVVVLGGTSLMGGRGGIPQTFVGLLIYGTLRNGLDNIPSIDPLTKEFVTGVVLLIALIINVVFSGRRERDRT